MTEGTVVPPSQPASSFSKEVEDGRTFYEGVADPGDEIICPDPGFPSYHAVASYMGIKEAVVPLREGFRLDPQAAAELREVEAGSLSLSDLRTRLLERYRRPSSVG